MKIMIALGPSNVAIYDPWIKWAGTRVYRKKTFSGPFTNMFSFTSYFYKVGYVKTLVDRAYKITNTRLGFREDITKLEDILFKRRIFLVPTNLIKWVINRFIASYSRAASFRSTTFALTFLSEIIIVQSLKSPFFPPHIRAEPRRAKRESRITLHVHAQNEPIKNY